MHAKAAALWYTHAHSPLMFITLPLCDQGNVRDEGAGGSTVTSLTPPLSGWSDCLGDYFYFSLTYQFVISSRCRSLRASSGNDLQGLDERGQDVFTLPFCASAPESVCIFSIFEQPGAACSLVC